MIAFYLFLAVIAILGGMWVLAPVFHGVPLRSTVREFGAQAMEAEFGFPQVVLAGWMARFSGVNSRVRVTRRISIRLTCEGIQK